MKDFHPISFILGIVCGVLVCVIGFLMVITLHGHPQLHRNNQQPVSGNWNTSNREAMIERMAQRLGMTNADLTKELTSGKTMLQIVSEHQKDASISSSSSSTASSVKAPLK